MQQIDWSDFQTFLAIARAGQLTKAGALMGVNATTMGRRLRRLERCVGATLFEQTREGQVLTEAGEQLLVKVEAMAQSAAYIGDDVGQGTSSQLMGKLRISVSEGFGSWFLSPLIPDFMVTHPALTLDLVASSGFLSLSKREADIAVMLSRPKAGPIVARKLSDYTLRLYAHPAYLSAYGVPGGLIELADRHRLIGYIPDLLYAPELRYLDEIHPGLMPKIRSSSIIAQHQLIASSAGIGVLPCFMGDADPRIEPVLPDHRITRTFWLATHQDTRQLARVRAVHEWIVDCTVRYRDLLLPP